MKRLLAILLASAMAFHLMPLQTIALSNRFSSSAPVETVGNPDEPTQENSEKLLRSSEETNSAGFSVGNNITDILINGRTAVVSYAAETEADLVVGIYADDAEEELIASGTADVAKTADGTAKVEIIGDIPEHYVIKGYLFEKEEHVPLCEPFKNSFYTKKIADVRNAAVKDFPEERVLNLDDDEQTNFAVVKQDVTFVKAEDGFNKITQRDEESLTYTVSSAGDEIKNLHVGDVLVLDRPNETPLILRANNISVNGDTVTLSGDGTLRLEDVFSALKIEKNESCQSVEELSGENATGSTTLKTDYSVAVYLSENEKQISLAVENQVEGNAELTEKGEKSVSFEVASETLARGVSLSMEPVVKVRAEGKASTKFSLKTEDGVRWDGSSHSTGKDPAAELESPADVSVTVEMELTPMLDIFNGMTQMTLKTQTGIKAESTKKGGEQLEDGIRHACKECYSVTKTEISRVEAELRRSKDEKAQKEPLSKAEKTLGKTYHSTEYGTSGEGDCPNYSYRVRLTLDGVKTEGVAIFRKDSDGALMVVGATDENGAAEIYFVPGQYAFSAKTGGKEYNGECEVTDCPVAIVLKTKEKEDTEPPEEIVEAFGNCGENLRWIVDKNGVLTIDGSGEMRDYHSNPAMGKLPPWNEEELRKRFGMENVSITKIVLKEGITRIGESAFAGMKITEVSIPETVKAIGAFSFKACKALKKMELPKTLTKIGREAFAECTALEEVIYEGSRKEWSEIDIRSGNELLENAKITYQTVDEPEDEIKDNETEDKPDEVGKEDTPGEGNKEDEPEEKPDEGNKDEEKEDKPEEGSKEDKPAEDDNDEVKEDRPDESDKGNEPKEDDSGKDDESEDKPGKGDEEIEDKPDKSDKDDEKGDEDKKDEEPETPEEDPNGGRCGENLTWKLSENGMLSIYGNGRMDDYKGTKTPWNLQDVKGVVIENGVTTIGRNAFMGCNGLKEIQLPETVEVLGEGAFADSGLKMVTIPVSMRRIEENVFSGCVLELVFYAGTKSEWRAIEILETGNAALFAQVIHCINGNILPDIENTITAGTAGRNDNSNKLYAVFNGLTAGESYAVIVSKSSEDPFEASSLIYLNQKKADANGILEVPFVSGETEDAYVVACGREPEKPKYTVTVKVGDAVVKTVEAAEGENVTIEVPEKLDDGRIFQKWNVDTGNVELVDAGSFKTSFTMAAEDVVLHAVYKTSGGSPDDGGITKPDDPGSSSGASPSGDSGNGSSGSGSGSTAKPDKPDSGSNGSSSSGSSGSSSSGSASSGSSSSSSSTSNSSSFNSPSDNRDSGGSIAAVVWVGGAAIAAVTAGVILMMPVEVGGIAQMSDGTVLANATVQLMKDGRLAAQTMTDESGRFAMKIKRGEYQMNVIAVDSETGEQIVRTVGVKAPAKNMNFVF